ncbi:phage portal protein family protein [Thiothrix nivea]|uniref:Mu-like prophage protein gp29 n=1 Tax=Thiothrix nivea (strain ATCC 35100 / DSM 5205 / JP2) TaxID=870187 RepID=A0A656HE90_THINJ|nr:DUF935 family protein [Thiothrix nivea]EIJ33355.1 protein of unknown function DUF935 [Thiothrix nivea DSM 5205]
MIKQITAIAKRALRIPDEIVTRANDPNFYQALDILPNPDPILAKLGKDTDVYNAIQYDAHVMGELRSLRAGLLGYDWRIVPGGEDAASQKAFQAIMQRMEYYPASGSRWDDWIWTIYKAVLMGQSIHEIGWEYDGTFMFPRFIKDRPARRFAYSAENNLKVLTRSNPLYGETIDGDYRLLTTRHMPSHDNPYGVAVLSACFWPYTFKHAGWKWFAKFAEKYGIPWAVGTYPAGSDQKFQRELAERLAAMIEDAVAAIPEGASVELKTPSTSGDPIQERLINLANREMSKALTSQTLATEIQGNGSRAAADTHSNRQAGIASSDRKMISETVSQLLSWITEINFPGAKASWHEFYEESDPREGWANTLNTARKFLPVSREFAYERLQITPPKAGDELLDAVDPAPAAANFRHGGDFVDFTTTGGNAVDPIAMMLPEIKKILGKHDNLTDAQTALDTAFPGLDDSVLRAQLELTMLYEYLRGMEAATSDS